MTARWFNPATLMRMHYGNLVHPKAMHEQLHRVLVLRGADVPSCERLPHGERVRQAVEDFIGRRSNSYLDETPGLFPEFCAKLAEFEALATAR